LFWEEDQLAKKKQIVEAGAHMLGKKREDQRLANKQPHIGGKKKKKKAYPP